MAAIFAFKCSACAAIHEGSPSFGFLAPDPYASLSHEEQTRMATLSDDLCTIAHPEQTDRFVRAVLEVPIHGVEEPFLWGVWVSLSDHARPSDVVIQPAGLRPKVVLHRRDPQDDSLVVDQTHGISFARAQELAELALHGN